MIHPLPVKVLSDQQTIEVARKLFGYAADFAANREQILEATAAKFSLSEGTVFEKLRDRRALKRIEADFVIGYTIRLITGHAIREQFLLATGEHPESFGYAVPTDEPLPFQPRPEVNEATPFEKFKNGLGTTVRQKKQRNPQTA
jgi:hypothetical protein